MEIHGQGSTWTRLPKHPWAKVTRQGVEIAPGTGPHGSRAVGAGHAVGSGARGSLDLAEANIAELQTGQRHCRGWHG